MQVFTAQDIRLAHLFPVQVSYPPKQLHTEALQVTIENIGKLSLEFEEELFYDAGGHPYFVFAAERGTALDADQPRTEITLYVRLTDWIVPLRGELHVFRNVIFQSTFLQPSNEFETPVRNLGDSNQPVLRSPQPLVPDAFMFQHGSFESEAGDIGGFSVDDRVCVKGTEQTGKVVVTNVDHGYGSLGVEVELDSTGQKRVFGVSQIVHEAKP
jgi:hypothetical protein